MYYYTTILLSLRLPSKPCDRPPDYSRNYLTLRSPLTILGLPVGSSTLPQPAMAKLNVDWLGLGQTLSHDIVCL